jgi:hypothetical protein
MPSKRSRSEERERKRRTRLARSAEKKIEDQIKEAEEKRKAR